MIKIENTEVIGWQAAIRGMRNPMNSWDKSDSLIGCNVGNCNSCNFKSDWCGNTPQLSVGESDLDLMKRLVNAGSDHSKFMRMINVTCDVTAPLYWIAEHDTYKVATVRNSCSFMHKGVSKPFTIMDFSIHENRVYEILSPLSQNQYVLKYPYETDEKRIYTCANGRKYDVYKNGRVFSHEFFITDEIGRTRSFKRKECVPSRNSNGYFELHLGGRNGEKWTLHRLVANVWIENPQNFSTVNHIDGDKGNNSVENLEWCSLEDNIQKGFDENLYNNVKSLHASYIKWKNSTTLLPIDIKRQLLYEIKTKDISGKDIAEKYGISVKQANNIKFGNRTEYEDLFLLCYTYEKIIDVLNQLRDIYLETNDNQIFQQIRCLLPCGYNQKYTWQSNYATLRNIYHSRKNHKLDEWHDFCNWIESLPYARELITI